MHARVVVVVAGVLAGASCFSSARYDQAHQQRVAEINGRYDSERRDAEQRGEQLAATADELRKFLVDVQPGSAYSPVDRFDHADWFIKLQALCNGLDTQVKAASGDAELQRQATECWRKLYAEIYMPALKARYYRADAAGTVQLWLDSKGSGDLEALFAYSHNTAVLAEIQSQKAEIQALTAREVVDIERERQSEVWSSGQQLDRELEEAHAAYRARMAAVGNALSTLGQSMSQPPAQNTGSTVYTSPPSTTTSRAPANSCTSDFECAYGSQCVKQMYSVTGLCATSVNQYGVPTFSPPNLGSVGSKMPVSTDCKLITDCPIGFACDLGSGACLRSQ